MSDEKKNRSNQNSQEDFLSEDRKRKVEEFEVNIEDTYKEDEEIENLMSYSDDKKKNMDISLKNETSSVKKSAKNVKFFKSIWIVMIVSICLMLGQFVIFGTFDMLAITRNDNVVKVEIPKGAGKNAIANILYEKGVIKQPGFFKMYLLLTKGSQKFIPGSFEIKSNLDYEATINYLLSNANRIDSDIVDVTVPEGKNIIEIAGILEKNEICSSDEFLKACKSNDFNKDYDFIAGSSSKDIIYKLEGYLFPDTYSFYKNVEPKSVIKKFLNNFENKVSKKLLTDESNEKVSVKTLAERKSMSISDVINFASLVQAEASNDADMPGVAAVISNRLSTLNNGGKSTFGDAINGCLSLDSTTWYPYRSKDKVPSNIVDTYESPYDTYKFSGFPKGPICNPGITAIESVLTFKPTQYYFYCHSKEGKTFYAKSFSEHGVNLKKAGLA